MNSKAISVSTKKKKNIAAIISYFFFLSSYLVLLIAESAFTNIMVVRVRMSLRENWTAISEMYETEFHLSNTIQQVNKEYTEAVKKFLDPSQPDAPRIKPGFAVRSAKLGLEQFSQFQLAIVQKITSAKVRAEPIIRDKLVFDRARRFGFINALPQLSDLIVKSSIPMNKTLMGYIPHFLLKAEELGNKMDNSRPDQFTAHSIARLRFQVLIFNFFASETALFDLEKKFSSGSSLVIEESTKRFLEVLSGYLIFTFSAILLNCTALFFSLLLVNRKLHDLINCYKLLKPTEIDFLLLNIQENLSICEKFKFHEKLIIESFTKIGEKWHEIRFMFKAGLAKYDNLRKKQNLKIRKIGLTPSVRIGASVNILIFILMLAMTLILYLLQKGFSKSARVLELYREKCELVSRANKNYIFLQLSQTFGAAFSKTKANSEKYRSSFHHLVGYWERRRDELEELLGESRTSGFNRVFESELCSLLHSSDFGYLDKKETCIRVLTVKAASSPIQKLALLQQRIDATRDFIQILETEFMEKTSPERLDLSYVNISRTVYSSETVPMHALFEVMIPTLHARLNEYFKEQLDIDFESMGNIMMFTDIYLALAILFLLLICLVCSANRLVEEYNCCLETFQIIYPDIILNNPYLLNSFRTYFRFSIS